MSRPIRKIQMTVRVTPDVWKAAKAVERRTQTPVSVVVADAARRTLMPEPEGSPVELIEESSKRVLQRLDAFENLIGSELLVLKELIGLLSRAYFNHTPAIPESERNAASLSGRARFFRMMKHLSANLADGASIFDEIHQQITEHDDER